MIRPGDNHPLHARCTFAARQERTRGNFNKERLLGTQGRGGRGQTNTQPRRCRGKKGGDTRGWKGRVVAQADQRINDRRLSEMQVRGWQAASGPDSITKWEACERGAGSGGKKGLGRAGKENLTESRSVVERGDGEREEKPVTLAPEENGVTVGNLASPDKEICKQGATDGNRDPEIALRQNIH